MRITGQKSNCRIRLVNQRSSGSHHVVNWSDRRDLSLELSSRGDFRLIQRDKVILASLPPRLNGSNQPLEPVGEPVILNSGFVQKFSNGLSCRFLMAGHSSSMEVSWYRNGAQVDIETGYKLETSSKAWFGIGELINQQWPLSHSMLGETPFCTWDNGPQGLLPALSPLFWCENGVGVFVSGDGEGLRLSLNREQDVEHQPVHTGHYINVFDQASLGDQVVLPDSERPPSATPQRQGDDNLRLIGISKYSQPFTHHLFLPSEQEVEGSIASTYKSAFLACCGHPEPLASKAMLEGPIWSTWAQYKEKIDADKVMSLALAIRERALPGSILELDDRWQVHYGDIEFDPGKFSDPKSLVDKLHNLGFKVTLWVPPFIHNDADNYQYCLDKGYLLATDVPWWQKPEGSGLIDLFNADALEWWYQKLVALQQSTGVDGFKFDGGEGNFVPGGDKDAVQPTAQQNAYVRKWVDLANRFPIAEVRCGYSDTRQKGILLRMFDKSSNWGLQQGLQSVVTGALSLSVSGYPYLLPDMIGGNLYESKEIDYGVSEELYARWLEASIAMPAIQFSLVPWEYSEEFSSRIGDLLNVREYLLKHHIMEAVTEAPLTGLPAIRPLFFAPGFSGLNAEQKRFCHRVSDQFMVGENLLAAPVLVEGVRSRRVFVPPGNWRQLLIKTDGEVEKGKVIKGGQDAEYRAELMAPLLFERL